MKFSILLLLSPLILAKPCSKRSTFSLSTTTSETSSSYAVSSITTSSFASSTPSTASSGTSTSSDSATSSATLTESATTSSTVSSALPAATTCGASYEFPSDTTYRIKSSIFVSLPDCQEDCLATDGCLSYVYGDFLGGCVLYSVSASELGGEASTNSNEHFYDISCALSVATPSVAEIEIPTITSSSTSTSATPTPVTQTITVF
ncbi:hypothetical protein F4819DRAFT_507151 [Hypoxylon fuscum]|nr:hypothetical protein F4819DRAFT_507151 [Hypoxylon fuscum]